MKRPEKVWGFTGPSNAGHVYGALAWKKDFAKVVMRLGHLRTMKETKDYILSESQIQNPTLIELARRYEGNIVELNQRNELVKVHPIPKKVHTIFTGNLPDFDKLDFEKAGKIWDENFKVRSIEATYSAKGKGGEILTPRPINKGNFLSKHEAQYAQWTSAESCPLCGFQVAVGVRYGLANWMLGLGTYGHTHICEAVKNHRVLLVLAPIDQIGPNNIYVMGLTRVILPIYRHDSGQSNLSSKEDKKGAEQIRRFWLYGIELTDIDIASNPVLKVRVGQ